MKKLLVVLLYVVAGLQGLQAADDMREAYHTTLWEYGPSINALKSQPQSERNDVVLDQVTARAVVLAATGCKTTSEDPFTEILAHLSIPTNKLNLEVSQPMIFAERMVLMSAIAMRVLLFDTQDLLDFFAQLLTKVAPQQQDTIRLHNILAVKAHNQWRSEGKLPEDLDQFSSPQIATLGLDNIFLKGELSMWSWGAFFQNVQDNGIFTATEAPGTYAFDLQLTAQPGSKILVGERRLTPTGKASEALNALHAAAKAAFVTAKTPLPIQAEEADIKTFPLSPLYHDIHFTAKSQSLALVRLSKLLPSVYPQARGLLKSALTLAHEAGVSQDIILMRVFISPKAILKPGMIVSILAGTMKQLVRQLYPSAEAILSLPSTSDRTSLMLGNLILGNSPEADGLADDLIDGHQRTVFLKMFDEQKESKATTPLAKPYTLTAQVKIDQAPGGKVNIAMGDSESSDKVSDDDQQLIETIMTTALQPAFFSFEGQPDPYNVVLFRAAGYSAVLQLGVLNKATCRLARGELRKALLRIGTLQDIVWMNVLLDDKTRAAITADVLADQTTTADTFAYILTEYAMRFASHRDVYPAARALMIFPPLEDPFGHAFKRLAGFTDAAGDPDILTGEEAVDGFERTVFFKLTPTYVALQAMERSIEEVRLDFEQKGIHLAHQLRLKAGVDKSAYEKRVSFHHSGAGAMIFGVLDESVYRKKSHGFDAVLNEIRPKKAAAFGIVLVTPLLNAKLRASTLGVSEKRKIPKFLKEDMEASLRTAVFPDGVLPNGKKLSYLMAILDPNDPQAKYFVTAGYKPTVVEDLDVAASGSPIKRVVLVKKFTIPDEGKGAAAATLSTDPH